MTVYSRTTPCPRPRRRSSAARLADSQPRSIRSCSTSSRVGFCRERMTSPRSRSANFWRARCRAWRTAWTVNDLPSFWPSCSASAADSSNRCVAPSDAGGYGRAGRSFARRVQEPTHFAPTIPRSNFVGMHVRHRSSLRAFPPALQAPARVLAAGCTGAAGNPWSRMTSQRRP